MSDVYVPYILRENSATIMRIAKRRIAYTLSIPKPLFPLIILLTPFPFPFSVSYLDTYEN